jgi:hypothetical protein
MPFRVASFWERTSGTAFSHKNTPDSYEENLVALGMSQAVPAGKLQLRLTLSVNAL